MESLSRNNYWTRKQKQKLKLISSPVKFAKIAISVLESMPQPISELCGPISTGGLGDFDKNIKVFKRGIKELKFQGLNPFDQTPLQLAFDQMILNWKESGNTGYCLPILEVYELIFKSGLINEGIFLPGWESSFGARWERETLSKLGIKISEFPEEWYIRILQEIELLKKFSKAVSL